MFNGALESAKRMMIRRDLRRRGITDPRVLRAMQQTPREAFVPESVRDEAYADRALPIDCGQTVSQPYIVALMTQSLRLEGHERVLEIGTGSGYQTAILCGLCASVVSIERHAELSRAAGVVLALLGCKNVELVVGDGTLGWPARAPYDRIIVTAAAERCPPALLEQLGAGGKLIMPIGGPGDQVLQAITKQPDGTLAVADLSACRFVPLVGEQGWSEP